MNSRPHDPNERERVLARAPNDAREPVLAGPPKDSREPVLAGPPKDSREPVLALEGLVARPQTFRAQELAQLPAAAQVADVGLLVPGRKGRAVRLATLLDAAGVEARARFVDVSSLDPNFAVSESLEALRGALIVYALDGAPLARDRGGPFRLLVPGHGDECVHVKGLARLTLAAARGRDTRPVDDAEHAKLHAKKKA